LNNWDRIIFRAIAAHHSALAHQRGPPVSAPTATVVVATDFSPHARHAAQRAAHIAGDTGAHLRLLHVLPGPLMTQLRAWLGRENALEPELRTEARRALDEHADELRAIGAAEVATALDEGPVLDAVLADADARDARLLVLGTRGAGFMRRATLGSTCERLLHCTTRPMLAVRQAPHEAYRRVMVAVDFSAASLPTLRCARWLAPQAKLLLTTVYQLPYESRLRMAGIDERAIAGYREHCHAQANAQLQALAAQAGLQAGQWQPCIAEGDPSFKLVELEQMLDCDLVAVGKRGSAKLTDLLLGSVTQRVLTEGTADVLIARN
jgi:nucleotide-binding universal stress UspA family protein